MNKFEGSLFQFTHSLFQLQFPFAFSVLASSVYSDGCQTYLSGSSDISEYEARFHVLISITASHRISKTALMNISLNLLTLWCNCMT